MRPGLAALTFLLVAAPAGAEEPVPADLGEGWEHSLTFSQGKIYRKELPDSSLKAVHARGTIDAPAWAVRLVVLSPSKFQGVMPRLAEEKVLAGEGCQPEAAALPGCKVVYVYNRISMPVIQDRDYTLRVELTRDELGKGGAFVQSWRLDTANGPAPKSGVTRMSFNQGYWELSADGEKTLFRYSIETDPGGAVPNWAVNRANQSEVPRMLQAVEVAARQLAREHAGAKAESAP